MKKLFNLTVGLFLCLFSFAQAPQMFSYQAVVRNSNNQPVVNQKVGMRISILYAKPFGNAVYQEYHSPNTNENGLVSIIIGAGDPPITGYMDSIKWGEGPYYLLTEIDPTGGSNYTITGSTQLLSVPYAMHAGNGVPAFSSDPDAQNQPLYNCMDGPRWGPCPPVIALDSLGGINISNLYTMFGRVISYGTASVEKIYVEFSESFDFSNATGTFFDLSGDPFKVPINSLFDEEHRVNGKNLKPNTNYYVRAMAFSYPFQGKILKSAYAQLANPIRTDAYLPGDTVMVNGRPSTVAFVNRNGEVFGCAMLGQSLNFGCDGITLPGSLELEQSGRLNTSTIVAACSSSAARLADQWVSQDNFDQWFMPSHDELMAVQLGIGLSYYLDPYYNPNNSPMIIGSSNAESGLYYGVAWDKFTFNSYFLDRYFEGTYLRNYFDFSESLNLLGMRKLKQL